MTAGAETHHKGIVVAGADGMLQKPHGGFLLELKTPFDRTAGVDQQTNAQRQVCLLREINDGLRRFMVIENIEIFLVEVADELTMLVRGNKQDVYFIDPLADGYRGLDGIHVWGSHRRAADVRRCLRLRNHPEGTRDDDHR